MGTEDIEDTGPLSHLTEIDSPDIIHNDVQNHIKKQQKEFPDPVDTDFTPFSHPLGNEATQPETIKEIYNHYKMTHMTPEVRHPDDMSEIFKHKNTPVDLAKDYISHITSEAGHGDCDMAEAAASHKDLDVDFLESVAKQNLDSLTGKERFSSGKIFAPDYFNVRPEFVHQILENLPGFEPESGNIPEEALQRNHKGRTMYKWAHSALSRSKHHTKESLDKAVEFFSGKPYGNTDMYSLRDSLERFAGRDDLTDIHRAHLLDSFKNNPDLSSYEIQESSQNLVEKMKDPVQLASYANAYGSGNSTTNLLADLALKHPSLPKETIDFMMSRLDNMPGYEKRAASGSLLDNPSLTPEHISKLINLGVGKAVTHGSAKEEDINKFLDVSTGSSKENAETVLSRKEIPESTLIKLVNHKNQDVAIAALKHPSVTKPVVDSAIKRKASRIKDAASLHPISIKENLTNNINDNKVTISSLFSPDNELKVDEGSVTAENREKLWDNFHKANKDKEYALSQKDDKNQLSAVFRFASLNGLDPKIKEKAHDHILKAVKKDALHTFEQWNSDASKAFGSLLRSNHSKSITEWTKNPNTFRRFLGRDNLKSLSTENQNKVLDKVLEFDNSQNDSPVDELYSVITSGYGNENISKLDVEHVEKLLTNKDLLDSFSEAAYAGGHRTREGFEISKLIGGLSPTDKAKTLDSMIATGHQGALVAIVRSEGAPKEQWEKAFLSIPTKNTLHNILYTQTLNNHPDSQKFKRDLANGAHSAIYGIEAGEVRQAAIAHLLRSTSKFSQYRTRDDSPPPSAETVQEIINNAISNGHNDGLDLGELTSEFRRQVEARIKPSSVFTDDETSNVNLVRNARIHSKDLGDDLLGLYIGRKLYSEDESRKDISPEEYSQRIEKIKLDMDNLHDQHADSQALSYIYLINKDIFSTSHSNDFLLDIQASQELRDEIKLSAFSKGILSPAVSNQLSTSDPDLFEQAFSEMNIGEQFNKINAIIESGEVLHPKVANIVVGKITPNMLNVSPRGKGLSSEKISEYKNRMSKLVDVLTKSGKKDLSRVLTVLSADRHFTRTDSRELIKHSFDIISDNPNIDQSDKNDILTKFSESISGDLIPKSFFVKQAKEAQKNGDIESLIQIASGPAAPSSAFTQLSNTVAKIDNHETLYKTSDLLSRGMSAPSLDKLSKNILKRAKDLSILHNDVSIYTKIRDNVDSRLVDGFRRSSSPSKTDTLRNRTIHGRIEQSYKEALQENDQANISRATKNMLSLLDRDRDNSTVSSDIFKALPDMLPDDTVKYIPDYSFPNLVKDPENISIAKQGWKLSILASSFKHIPNNIAETVFDRVMTETRTGGSIPDEYAYQTLQGALVAGNVEQDKLHRSLEAASDTTLIELMSAPTPDDFYSNTKESLDKLKKTMAPLYASYASRLLTSGISEVMNMSEMGHTHLRALSRLREDKDRSPLLEKLSGDFTKAGMQHMNRYLELDSSSTDIRTNRLLQSTILSTSILLSSAPQEDQVAFFNLYNNNNKFHKSISSDYRNSTEYEDIVKSWATNSNLDEKSQSELFNTSTAAATAYLNYGHGIYKNAFPKDKFINLLRSNFDDRDHLGAAFFNKIIDMDTDEATAFFSDHCTTHFHIRSVESFTDKFGKKLSDKNVSDVLKSLFATSDTVRSYDLFVNQMIRHGSGGKSMANILLQKINNMFTSFSIDHRADNALEHPSVEFFKDEEWNTIIDKLDKNKNERYNEHSSLDFVKSLSKNNNVPSNVLHKLYSNIKNGTTPVTNKNTVIRSLSCNKNLGFDLYKQIFNDTKEAFVPRPGSGEGFHPAFKNPLYGRELFSTQPITVPENVKNISTENLVTSAIHSVSRNRLKSLLDILPSNGMTWKDLKKTAPKLENHPQVKNLFMSKKDTLVKHEDVIEAMNKSEGADFFVTYSSWEGIQRHGDGTNLVVQLNTSKKMQEEISKDPDMWDFYLMIQESANFSGHPVTPHACSWSRVDTSAGEKGWSIEEFQSDFSRRLGDTIRKVLEQGNGKSSRYTPEQGEEYGAKIQKAFEGWYEASLSAVIESAKKHGVKELFIHGPGIRSTLSSKGKDSVPESWNFMYEKYPKSIGFEKVDYSDYPNFSNRTLEEAKNLGHSTHCFRLKLT